MSFFTAGLVAGGGQVAQAVGNLAATMEGIKTNEQNRAIMQFRNRREIGQAYANGELSEQEAIEAGVRFGLLNPKAINPEFIKTLNKQKSIIDAEKAENRKVRDLQVKSAELNIESQKQKLDIIRSTKGNEIKKSQFDADLAQAKFEEFKNGKDVRAKQTENSEISANIANKKLSYELDNLDQSLLLNKNNTEFEQFKLVYTGKQSPEEFTNFTGVPVPPSVQLKYKEALEIQSKLKEIDDLKLTTAKRNEAASKMTAEVKAKTYWLADQITDQTFKDTVGAITDKDKTEKIKFQVESDPSIQRGYKEIQDLQKAFNKALNSKDENAIALAESALEEARDDQQALVRFTTLNADPEDKKILDHIQKNYNPADFSKAINDAVESGLDNNEAIIKMLDGKYKTKKSGSKVPPPKSGVQRNPKNNSIESERVLEELKNSPDTDNVFELLNRARKKFYAEASEARNSGPTGHANQLALLNDQTDIQQDVVVKQSQKLQKELSAFNSNFDFNSFQKGIKEIIVNNDEVKDVKDLKDYAYFRSLRESFIDGVPKIKKLSLSKKFDTLVEAFFIAHKTQKDIDNNISFDVQVGKGFSMMYKDLVNKLQKYIKQ